MTVDERERAAQEAARTTPVTVLYVMGAGHVGSTAFDVVLGLHPSLESSGELTKLYHPGWETDSKQVCSCGERLDECDRWARIRERWAQATGGDVERHAQLQRRYERSRGGWLRLLRRSRDVREYEAATAVLYRSIREFGGRPIVVESSLSPRRAFALSRNPAIDLRVVHFLRDGRGCLWSLTKRAVRRERTPPTAASVARYWVSANLQSLLVALRVPASRRVRVRYEDFVTRPADVLARVGPIVGLDLGAVASRVSDGRSARVDNHMPGGNRTRFLREISLRADFAWERELPVEGNRAFWRRAGWLAARLGYAERGAEPGPAGW